MRFLCRALSNVADEGLLTAGFFWIPSLAGPTSLAAQKAVSLPSGLNFRSEPDDASLNLLEKLDATIVQAIGSKNPFLVLTEASRALKSVQEAAEFVSNIEGR